MADNHYSPCQEQLDNKEIREEAEQTKDLALMKELTKIYQQRIQDINSLNQDGSCNELKIKTLEAALKDLGDLNVMLVDTVSQLERETVKHVKIFERHLFKSSDAAERFMSRVEEMNSIARENSRDLRRSKEEEEDLLEGATALNTLQVKEISDLQNDLKNLIELIRRVKEEGSWKVDDLEFQTVSVTEILGPNTEHVHEGNSNTEFRSSQSAFTTAVPEQAYGYENLYIDQLTAELVSLRCAQEEAAMFASVREEEIHQLNEEIALLKEDMIMKDDELEILRRQFGESSGNGENFPFLSSGTLSQFSAVEDSETERNSSVWKDRALALESEILQIQSEMKKSKEETSDLEREMHMLTAQMKELQEKFLLATKEKDSLTKELEIKRKEWDSSVKELETLKQELKEMDGHARDVRAALTAEVAEKHDRILILKRENQILEEQLREANMQTHFKDDILKEMRKDLKILRARLLSVDPASEEFVSNGLRYMSKSCSLPMHLQETAKDDKTTQCLAEDFPVKEPRKESVLDKSLNPVNVSLPAASHNTFNKNNCSSQKVKNLVLPAPNSQNLTFNPQNHNNNYGGGDVSTNNMTAPTKDIFSCNTGESKLRLRQEKLLQCESEDLQVALLTEQLQHCQEHMSSQEKLIKDLEEQLEKSKMEHKDALLRTNSKRRLSLDESLGCFEESFNDNKSELGESVQQLQKSINQHLQQTCVSERELMLINNFQQYQAVVVQKLDMKDKIITSLQQAALETEDQHNHYLELQVAAEKKYNDISAENQELKTELEKIKLTVNDTDDDDKDKINKQESWRLSSEISSLKNQLIMVKDSLSNKEKIISNMDETIRALRDSFNVQTQEVTNLQFKIGIMGAENQEYEKQMKVMEDDMQNLRHQLETEKEEKSRALSDLSQNKKEMENQQIVMNSLKQALMTTKQQLENLEGKGYDGDNSVAEDDRQLQSNTSEYWRKYCSCLFEIVKQQSLMFNIKCDLTDVHTCASNMDSESFNMENVKKISSFDTHGDRPLKGQSSDCSYEKLLFKIETLKEENHALRSEINNIRRHHDEEIHPSQEVFAFNAFSKKTKQTEMSLHDKKDELEVLRSQIEEQMYVIQQLQRETTERKTSHISLTERYQARCDGLETLKDEHKNLKKKYEELKLENERSKSKWQEQVEFVHALEKKVKFLLDENSLLRNDVVCVQEENIALSNTNTVLGNNLSLAQEDNKILLDTLSDKETKIQTLEANEVDIHNKLVEITIMKNKVKVDFDDLKSEHAIQEEISRQNEERNMELKQQIKKLFNDLLITRQQYEEVKGLETHYMEVLNKNLLLEKEISDMKNQYEKQVLDNNMQILDLQQELSNSQNALKDMMQKTEKQNQLIAEKDCVIHQTEINFSNDISSMKMKIQHLTQQVQKLNSELSIKDSEYVRLGSRNTLLTSKLQSAESKISILQQVITDKETEFFKQLEKHNDEVAKLRSTIESLKFELIRQNDEFHLEPTKFLEIKCKVEELQKEIMKKSAAEMTLQRSLTTAELALTREKEKTEMKNSENTRLKCELFHLKTAITKWEHELPTVFTQGLEHDVTTEDFLSLRREMAKLKEEVNRLTAIYDNGNMEVRNYLGNWWWDDFLQMN